MPEEPYITEQRLMQLWRRTYNFMWSLRSRGVLRWDAKDGRNYLYRQTTIDTLHRESLPTTLLSFPPVATLLHAEDTSGEPSLLKLPEFTRHAPLRRRDSIRSHAEAGKIPAIRIDGGQWLLPRTALEAYRSPTVAVLTVGEIALILGLSREYILQISTGETPRLTRVPDPADRQNAYITEASLTAFLSRHLQGITAEEWVALRRSSGYELLLTVAEATRRFHCSYSTVHLGFEAGHLPRLDIPLDETKARRTLIPHSVFEAWIEAGKPHAPFKCPLPPRTVRSVTLAESAGVEHGVVVYDIEHGIMPGIKLSDGTYAVSTTEAAAYTRRMQRTLEGPSYHLRYDEFTG